MKVYLANQPVDFRKGPDSQLSLVRDAGSDPFSFELEILAAHVLGEILKGPRVFADETGLPTLAPGTGTVNKAWLWAYARDDSTFGGSGPPMVPYRFEDSRSGECVRRHLGGYGGILQVDGYAAYNQLVRKDGGNAGPSLA
ncbi:Transposase IS66 family protein, partial [Paracoccus denitrificans]